MITWLLFIVTKNIPSNSVAVGIPAKVIKTIDKYYEKNKKVVFTRSMNSQEKKDFFVIQYIEYKYRRVN